MYADVPNENIKIKAIQAMPMYFKACGSLLIDIKFLKSFKSFKSSVYDFESDFSSRCS